MRAHRAHTWCPSPPCSSGRRVFSINYAFAIHHDKLVFFLILRCHLIQCFWGSPHASARPPRNPHRYESFPRRCLKRWTTWSLHQRHQSLLRVGLQPRTCSRTYVSILHLYSSLPTCIPMSHCEASESATRAPEESTSLYVSSQQIQCSVIPMNAGSRWSELLLTALTSNIPALGLAAYILDSYHPFPPSTCQRATRIRSTWPSSPSRLSATRVSQSRTTSHNQ